MAGESILASAEKARLPCQSQRRYVCNKEIPLPNCHEQWSCMGFPLARIRSRSVRSALIALTVSPERRQS